MVLVLLRQFPDTHKYFPTCRKVRRRLEQPDIDDWLDPFDTAVAERLRARTGRCGGDATGEDRNRRRDGIGQRGRVPLHHGGRRVRQTGASADHRREVRPSNALQWRMLQDSHALGVNDTTYTEYLPLLPTPQTGKPAAGIPGAVVSRLRTRRCSNWL